MIVGTLATMVAPNLQRAREMAMNARAMGDIRVMEGELELYIQDNYFPPLNLGVIGRAGMLDPWGRPYEYLQIDTGPGGKNGGGASSGGRKDKFLVPLNNDYDLYSMGPDGESKKPLAAKASQDDILRALDGAFLGVAADF